MSKPQKKSVWKEQKAIKPPIEDVIPAHLDGDMKKRALDFVAYMRKNKMTLRWAGVQNTWRAIYKGKRICSIRLCADFHGTDEAIQRFPGVARLDKYSWFVCPCLYHIDEYEESVINEGLQHMIWDNLEYCQCYPTKCGGAGNMTILGKEIKAICVRNLSFTTFYVADPDETAISRVKWLLELEQQARIEEANAKKRKQTP